MTTPTTIPELTLLTQLLATAQQLVDETLAYREAAEQKLAEQIKAAQGVIQAMVDDAKAALDDQLANGNFDAQIKSAQAAINKQFQDAMTAIKSEVATVGNFDDRLKMAEINQIIMMH